MVNYVICELYLNKAITLRKIKLFFFLLPILSLAIAIPGPPERLSYG